MNSDDALHPLDEGDELLLAALRAAEDEHDPLPEGLIDRLNFAVSLELMEAELATLTEDDLAMARGVDPATVDTITFTASTISLMVMLTQTDDGVRIDAWVTGGGIEVELIIGTERMAEVSDVTGRLTWARVPHGSARFLINPGRPGVRPVVTPSIEV